MQKSNIEQRVIIIPVIGIGLNIGLTFIITLLKIPIYMDAVGTIIVTLMLGLRAGIITGVLSFVLMTVTSIGPFHIYFSGTQIAIACTVYLAASRGLFRKLPWVICIGILVGIIAAIVSAPVIVYLFGGIEANGPGLITAFLTATGRTITESVLLKGISVEPIDKTIQCLLAYSLLKSVPISILHGVSGGKLIDRNFAKSQ